MMDTAWALIIIAGLVEPCWVYTMERSDNFRSVGWTAATIVLMASDLYILSLAMQTIGAGMSYAVWTGIGAVGAVIMGIVVYKEPAKIGRVFLIMMIIAGIVGLNLTSGEA